MLGSITIDYNDFSSDKQVTESFDDVESVSIAGNPDSFGHTIIITHGTEETPNTVRSDVVLQSVS